ncbi:group II intron reverse transcriptase/maturase [Nostoc sp. UIC 10890]
MSKTEIKFKVEWSDDIPTCKGIEPEYNWNEIPWKKLERRTFKLQKRIYQASSREDVKAVRRLQKTLMNSWSAKCIAVRRVTQDNSGKNTAGVDGIKSIKPSERLNLVKRLKLTGKSKPTRRLWIPKPGTDEKRPLGIPTIFDRALQALVKLALEPEWEARFEPHSYGFRPGRSCHDAIEAIFNCICTKAKYVLDADIAQCFDGINHDSLLRKINTFPTLSRQLKAWLKSGVMDRGNLFPTDKGTPQGGVISPLLANIALHGMENRIQQLFPKRSKKVNGKKTKIPSPTLIRYADDFVIIHSELTTVQKCFESISEWLKDIGLELKPSKTKLTHTFIPYEGNVGFDFLGFHVRQYKVGNYRSAKTGNGNILGFNTLITPSKNKLHKHLENISRIIEKHKNAPQIELIKNLNPVIRGWANYYSTKVSKDMFSLADSLTYQKLRAWAIHRCSNSGKQEALRKYWHLVGNDNWCFSTRRGHTLIKHAETPIVRHTKVQGERSPYDGDFVYWSTRMGEHPLADSRVAKLLKMQRGRCTHCGLFFRDDERMEIDHIIPKSEGGKNGYNNLQLLHRHCHDLKTVLDGSYISDRTDLTEEYLSENSDQIFLSFGTDDNSLVAEEPDEAKVSCPVLNERWGK